MSACGVNSKEGRNESDTDAQMSELRADPFKRKMKKYHRAAAQGMG